MVQLLIKRSVEKEILSFPIKIKNLFYLAVQDLKEYGLHPEGWEVKKMEGYKNRYRIKVTKRYRLVYEWDADTKTIAIIEASTREGSYK